MIRLDAGYGNSHATVDALLEAQVGFVLKWRDSRVAKKIVREHQLQWQRHTREVRVAEGPSYLGVRSGLSQQDMAGLQALYGTRQPDAFDAQRPNDTLATAIK